MRSHIYRYTKQGNSNDGRGEGFRMGQKSIHDGR
jgi:hypothetical protein